MELYEPLPLNPFLEVKSYFFPLERFLLLESLICFPDIDILISTRNFSSSPSSWTLRNLTGITNSLAWYSWFSSRKSGSKLPHRVPWIYNTSFLYFNTLSCTTVVVVNITTMKTTFKFNFDFYQAFKQHGYTASLCLFVNL